MGQNQYGQAVPVTHANWRIVSGAGILSTTAGETTILTPSKAGDLELRVSLDGVTASATVEVLLETSPLSSLVVDPAEKIQLLEGDQVSLSAVSMDQYGQPIDIPLYWKLLTATGHLSSTTGEEVTFIATNSGEALV